MQFMELIDVQCVEKWKKFLQEIQTEHEWNDTLTSEGR